MHYKCSGHVSFVDLMTQQHRKNYRGHRSLTVCRTFQLGAEHRIDKRRAAQILKITPEDITQRRDIKELHIHSCRA